MLSSSISPSSSASAAGLSRRAVLKSGAAAIAALTLPLRGAGTRARKRVIVAGGGIGGLSCAFELMKLGHDVILLEASGRTGGHVKTLREGLPGGLYADAGAEQFPGRPAYALVWDYIDQFGLKPLRWRRNENVFRRIGDRWYSDQELADPVVLKRLGFAAHEADYVAQHGLSELPVLYLKGYFANFKDEFRPLGVGLDDLDGQLPADIFAREGASEAAIRFSRMGRRSAPGKPPADGDASALYRIWTAATIHNRGLRQQPKELYHLQGGNDLLTEALASRLGDRVRRKSPVTAVEFDGSSVTVTAGPPGASQQLRADHLVLSMSPLAVAGITMKPGWPADKAFALAHTRVGIHSRVLLLTRTPFWKGDWPSINLQTGNPKMGSTCETAEEVPGDQRLLFGTGGAVQTPEETVAAFRSFYPGKAKDTIEGGIVHQWWKEEPTCAGCEREPFPFGKFARIWPFLTESVGPVHFVGAAYDSLWRGMEAATRTGHRAAQRIDAA